MEVVNKVTEFLDQNIRIVRYGGPVLAVVGVSIILRHTHAFTIFQSANKIPAHLIERNSTLRGITKDVINGSRIIKVQHIPIFFRNLEKRQKYFGEKMSTMDVAIAGITPKEGCTEYLKVNLLHKKIKIIPLQATEGNCLEAVVYAKKSMLFPSICINKELIANGLAIAHHDKELANIRVYRNLSKELLTAEIKADKIGVGIWKRPSLKERFQNWWEKLKKKTKWIQLK